MTTPLDPVAVSSFVRVAELLSFTRAAEALGLSQSQISTRIKQLEKRLGATLLERHPRLVRLTAAGERFLPAARDLLAAQERALGSLVAVRETLRIGLSEQAVGADAPALLARIGRRDPVLVLSLRIERSSLLDRAFEAGEIDVAVIRRLDATRSGEILREDRFGWYGVPELARTGDEPVAMVSLVGECAVRAHALAALDRTGRPWREACVGGGMAAVLAAVGAGLGLSPMPARLAPVGSIDLTDALSLPKLPRLPVVMRARAGSPRIGSAIRELAAAIRAG